MKTILISILISLSSSLVYSQARLMLNNSPFIVIDNGANLVIDNGAANAITTLGTGGNIVSEDELDLIKWNVSTATGVHSIPWTNSNGVKIPLEINITGAGSAGGSLYLSTYATNNMNATWPAVAPAVNDMCSFTFADNASLKVIDRFWRIDANSYGTKPGVTMSFGYDMNNEGAGTNTLVEANLQAQRYNPNAGSGNVLCFSAPAPGTGGGTWEGLLFGNVNTGADNVNSAIVSAANFYKDWILVDNTTPLPVELLSFTAECDKDKVIIDWSTQTEFNNDYFIVEKSYDGITFFDLELVQGIGNSNVLQLYSIEDNSKSDDIVYYKLKQVDFDGAVSYHNIISTNCKSKDFEVNNVVFSGNKLNFNVSMLEDEDFVIYLYDSRGRLITKEYKHFDKSSKAVEINSSELSKGIYMLSLVGTLNLFTTKILKSKK